MKRENPITQYKKELIGWIKNLDDLEVLSQLIELKKRNESITSITEPPVEYSVTDDFDERFVN